MRFILASLLAVLITSPTADGQTPRPAHSLPTASTKGVPGYRLIRSDGPVYLIRDFRLDGSNYIVTDFGGKVMQHREAAVESIEPLSPEEARRVAPSYVTPGTTNDSLATYRKTARLMPRTTARQPDPPADDTREPAPRGVTIDDLVRMVRQLKAEQAGLSASLPSSSLASRADDPPSSARSSGSSAESSLCGAPTKKGGPCRRKVKGGGYCYQHRG